MTVNDLASAVNAQQQGAGQPSQVGKIGMEKPMAFSGPGSGAPYDPRTPGYQPGAGWQTMLRQYAMGAGINPNAYIQDRGMRPMWGDQQQSWEPQAAPAGMGLSGLLQRYRGY